MASSRRDHARRSASRWRPFGVVEIEHHLPIVLAGGVSDPLALTFEQFGHAALLGVGAFGQALCGLIRDIGGPAFQMWQQVADVVRGRDRETFANPLRNAASARFVERGLQRCQCSLLPRPTVRSERFGPPVRIDPTCSNRHDLFMKASGARAVYGKAAEQHNSRDRIGGDRQASLGQVVVNQSLRGESAEQAPGHTVLEMKLYGVFAEPSRILECNRPDGGPAPPFAQIFATLPTSAQGIQSSGPAGIAGE